MEKVEYGGISLDLPTDLCQNPEVLLEILTPDTWNNHLTDHHREMLMGFLPDFPEKDLEEKTRTLEMFFMDENFRFGTPIRKFSDQLSKGFFNPEIAKMRGIHRKMLYKEYGYRQKQYSHRMLEELLVRRKRILDIAGSLPPDEHPRIPRIPQVSKRKSRTSIEYRTKKRYYRELAAIRAEAGDSSGLSDDENYPEGPGASLNKKQRRQLSGLEGSLPADLLAVRATHSAGSLPLDLELKITPTNNPLDLTDDHFRAMLLAHKVHRSKKNSSPDLDTRGLTLQEVLSRAQMHSKRPLQRALVSPVTVDKSKKKVKKESNSSHRSGYLDSSSLGDINIKEEPQSDNLSISGSSTSTDSDSEDNSIPIKREPAIVSPTVKKRLGAKGVKVKEEPLDSQLLSPSAADLAAESLAEHVKEEVKLEVKDVEIKEEVVEDAAAIENSSELTAALESIGACIAPELTQETHICFFSLIRDVICSTSEQRMTRAQLESSIRVWQESAISPLNEWFGMSTSWVRLLPSALNFLCGHFSDIQPMDFVPYIEFKAQLKVFQWIGAGRDTDGHLEPLWQFWLANRDSVSTEWLEDEGPCGGNGEDGGGGMDVIPAPRCLTSWTVQAATPQEKDMYRGQEKLRYEKPHKAYTFRMHGYESVVGPVKGIYSQQTGLNKARGHSLLVPDRPAYVTILSLVRDAVARLPNGEGTRADICELLKESQYIAPLSSPTAENNLNSVVSGALDRLHYEHDPCVKYDTTRKLWIYLHRNRTEEEFERMHHLNGPGSHKPRKPAPRRQSRAKTKDAPSKAPPNVEPFASPSKVEKAKAEETLAKVAKVESPPIKLDLSNASSSLAHKTLTPVKFGGVRGGVGGSSVQTIQVSTASGVQTIKVAVPHGTQTLTKMAPQTLGKVPTQAITKVGGQTISRAPTPSLAKVAPQTLKAVTLPQSLIQAASASQGQMSPAGGLNSQEGTVSGVAVSHTNLAVASKGSAVLAGSKGRTPVVTLTTRDASKSSVTPVSQVVASGRSAQQAGQQVTTAPGGGNIVGGKVGNLMTTLTNVVTPATAKGSIFTTLGGIKVLQPSPQQAATGVSAGKVGNVVASGSSPPVVVNSSAGLQTLMGHKMVVSGNKVLFQGGKVVQAIVGNVSSVAPNLGGKQVLTGMLPGQQAVALENLRPQPAKAHHIQAGGGGANKGLGNVIQLAGGGGGGAVQRLTLVSPQGTPVPVNSPTQRLVMAAGPQAGKLDKTQVVQTIQTLQPALGLASCTTNSSSTTTTTTSAIASTLQAVSSQQQQQHAPLQTAQARFISVGQQHKIAPQTLAVGGKASVVSAGAGGGLRLVQPGGVGGTTVAVAGNAAAGNLITIGGKQVLLTSKPIAPSQQLQQLLVAGGNVKGLTSSTSGGTGVSTAGNAMVVATGGGGGQQIVLPASALQTSHLNLKGLQAFQNLKVIPASQVSTQHRGKPVLARIVSPAAMRGVAPSTQASSTTQGVGSITSSQVQRQDSN